MSMTTSARTALNEVEPGSDLTNPDYGGPEVPLAEFAYLRQNAPMFWNPQTQAESSFDDGGFWLATRHEDVRAISSAREGWSAEENTAIVMFDGSLTVEERNLQRNFLLNMDDPHHTDIRGIVSRGCFTPRGVAKIESMLEDMAVRIVTEAKAKGEGDFVLDVASELPLQAIAELVGIPQEDRHKIFQWSNEMMAYADPEYDVDPAQSAAELMVYAMAMGEDRKACPMDDIATKLVAATGDSVLTSEEFGYFMLILAVAGNETTRNAISHGMQAFFDHPDQWELYKAERPETTADEIVRWATPVVMFQRTAVGDQKVAGVTVKDGQRVGMVYSSANNDETVFEHPERFDITRDPNPHVGFGGGGTHYCVGANLAKVEINLMFNAIADHLPDISRLGPPERLRSGWLNGIKHFPVRYTA